MVKIVTIYIIIYSYCALSVVSKSGFSFNYDIITFEPFLLGSIIASELAQFAGV